MMGGEVTVDLAKRGHKVTVMAVEQWIILDSVSLKMVLKVGSLSHNLEADWTLVTGVVLKGLSSHHDLVRNVNNGLGVSPQRRLGIGGLGNAVIEPYRGVVIVNALYGAAIIQSDDILAGGR